MKLRFKSRLLSLPTCLFPKQKSEDAWISQSNHYFVQLNTLIKQLTEKKVSELGTGMMNVRLNGEAIGGQTLPGLSLSLGRHWKWWGRNTCCEPIPGSIQPPAGQNRPCSRASILSWQKRKAVIKIKMKPRACYDILVFFLALSKSSPGCWVNRSIFWAQSQSSVNPWSQDDLGSAPMDLLAAEREPMMAGEDGMAGQSKAVSWASKMPSLLAFWNNPARLAGWGQ